jgi:uncharacterized membrane protein
MAYFYARCALELVVLPMYKHELRLAHTRRISARSLTIDPQQSAGVRLLRAAVPQGTRKTSGGALG